MTAAKLRAAYLWERGRYAQPGIPAGYAARVDDVVRLRHYRQRRCGAAGPATSIVERVTCEACYAAMPREQQKAARTLGHMRYVLGLAPLPGRGKK